LTVDYEQNHFLFSISLKGVDRVMKEEEEWECNWRKRKELIVDVDESERMECVVS